MRAGKTDEPNIRRSWRECHREYGLWNGLFGGQLSYLSESRRVVKQFILGGFRSIASRRGISDIARGISLEGCLLPNLIMDLLFVRMV